MKRSVNSTTLKLITSIKVASKREKKKTFTAYITDKGLVNEIYR